MKWPFRRTWAIEFTLRDPRGQIFEQFIDPRRWWTRSGAEVQAALDDEVYQREGVPPGLISHTAVKAGPFDRQAYLDAIDAEYERKTGHPIHRLMVRDPFGSRRYCALCADQNLITGFATDEALDQHTAEHHGVTSDH